MPTSSCSTRRAAALSTALIAVGVLGLTQQANAQEPLGPAALRSGLEVVGAAIDHSDLTVALNCTADGSVRVIMKSRRTSATSFECEDGVAVARVPVGSKLSARVRGGRVKIIASAGRTAVTRAVGVASSSASKNSGRAESRLDTTPAEVREQMRRQPGQRVNTRGGRPRALAAGWYDAGRVLASAHCFMGYLNVDQPLVKALAGYTTQWIAIKADYLGSPGAYYSDWYYAIASQWGEFVGLTGGGRFINTRTGLHTDSPGFLYQLLPSPSNVRMQVVWYGSGGIVRHITFWFQTSDFFNCY